MISNENIGRVLSVIRKINKQWPGGVVGRYVETPFTVLISCILSLRTQDKTTDQASERLFRLAKNPAGMLKVSLPLIRKAIYPVGFYNTKAVAIRKISQILLERYRGQVPDTLEELLELPGVGRKTANLTLTLGFGKPGICVDTHVHRINNRWGYVRTRTPEETEMALRAKLPARYWIEINDLLVTYGQNICQPVSPRCSICRIRKDCPRLGVKFSR
jgi:endonuclease III